MTTLYELYYNPKTGFQSAEKLYQKAKQADLDVSFGDVKRFLAKQEVQQLTHEPEKPKVYSSIVAPYPKFNFEIDLMIYDRFTFHNYKYILCCIDVYSRFAQARPLTNRNFSSILEKLEDIFSVMGYPENINADQEFNTHEFNEFCSKHNIKTWFSTPNEPNKNAIVERFNKTLAGMLGRVRLATKRHDWYNYLPEIIDNYNNTIHRTIKHTPAEVWTKKYDNAQEVTFSEETPLVPGQQVRIQLSQSIFTKGDAVKYSKDVYTIKKRVGNKYQLDGETTLYKRYQLLPIDAVEVYSNKSENDDQKEHESIQAERKLDRMMNKEGIEKNEAFDEPIQLRPRKEKPVKEKIKKVTSKKKKPEKFIIESIIGKKNEKIRFIMKLNGKNTMKQHGNHEKFCYKMFQSWLKNSRININSINFY